MIKKSWNNIWSICHLILVTHFDVPVLKCHLVSSLTDIALQLCCLKSVIWGFALHYFQQRLIHTVHPVFQHFPCLPCIWWGLCHNIATASPAASLSDRIVTQRILILFINFILICMRVFNNVFLSLLVLSYFTCSFGLPIVCMVLSWVTEIKANSLLRDFTTSTV